MNIVTRRLSRLVSGFILLFESYIQLLRHKIAVRHTRVLLHLSSVDGSTAALANKTSRVVVHGVSESLLRTADPQ